MAISEKNDWVFGVSVALVAFLVYANSLGNGFVWDDDVVIVANAALKGNIISLFSGIDAARANELTPYYRPLTLLTFLIEDRLHGLTPFFVRFINVFLHAANTFLVYRLARSITDVRIAALLTSLLFAVHPIHSEGVDFNAGGRNTMLAAFFILSAYLVHRRGVMRDKIAEAFAGSIIFLAGLLSKETALAILPFIVSLEILHGMGADAVRKQRMFLRLIPYIVCLVIYFALRTNALSSAGVTIDVFPGLWARLLENIYIIPKYLFLIICPISLNCRYFVPSDLSALILPLAAAWLCILTFSGWVIIKSRSRASIFGLLWAVAFWLPVSGVIPFPGAPLADRYLYVPAIGLWLCITDQFVRLQLYRSKTRLCLAAVAVLLLILVAITAKRNLDWKEPVALFSRVVEQYPEKAFGHFNLGCGYLEKWGNWDAAEREFEKTLVLDPVMPRLRTKMGYIRLQRGDVEGAFRHYYDAIRLFPTDTEALINMGIVLEKLYRYDDAIDAYRRFLAIPGDTPVGARQYAEGRVNGLSMWRNEVNRN